MLAVNYHPFVQEEITASASYYEGQCEGLGTHFLDDYDRAVMDILKWPTAWPLLESPYRRHQLKHFPYGIIYRVMADHIRILTLMHLHQHPDYRRGRE
jgi:hypothetical protein